MRVGRSVNVAIALRILINITESNRIILSDMAPFYEELCAELKWPIDNSLLTKMQSNNEETFKKLEETLKDAEENLGETEIRDALYAKAEYLCKIGDKVQYRIYFGCSSGF